MVARAAWRPEIRALLATRGFTRAVGERRKSGEEERRRRRREWGGEG